jgi:hypothetical protein
MSTHRFVKTALYLTFTVVQFRSAVGAAELEWGGYLRDDFTVTDRRYGAVMGNRLGNYLRLRLDLDAYVTDNVSVTATPQFIYLAGDRALDPYLGTPLESEYEVNLSRAQVDFFWDWLQITLGKQRLKLSTAYFYSPLDVFNPPDYTEPKSERDGVLSARSTIYFTSFSGARLIFQPEDTWHASPKAGRLFMTVWNFDLGASYIEPGYDKIKTVGFDFAGSIHDVGLFGEVAFDAHNPTGRQYPRSTVGLNYGWRDGPNFTLEYYRDQRGATDPKSYDIVDYIEGKRLTLGRDMAGGYVTYYPHPLWLLSFAAMVNVHDKSYYLNPSLTWSVYEDVELKVETDYFGGPEISEFYIQHPIYRVQVMAWF